MDEDKIITDYEAGEVSNLPSHPDDVKIGVDKLGHDVHLRKDGTRYAVYPSATSTSYSAKINPNANSEWWDESNIARDENGRRFYGSTPEEALAKYEYYKYQQQATHGGWNGWDMFNATTGGIFNQLSPTLFGRNLYNIATGNPNYALEWVYGNNGLVSDEFAANHPTASTFLNLLGDVAVFSAPNIARNVGNMGRTVSRWPRLLKKAYLRGDLIFDRTSDRFRNVHLLRIQNYADMYQDALSNLQALNAERTALEGELKSQFSTSPRFRSVVGLNPKSYWTRFDPTTGKFMLKTDGPVSDLFVLRDLLLNLENSYGAEMSDIRNAARLATRNFSKKWEGNTKAKSIGDIGKTVFGWLRYGSNKKINPLLEIAKGFDEAKEFLNSKVREDTFKHNIELAKRAGFKDFDEMSAYRDADRLSTPPNVLIIRNSSKGYMGRAYRRENPASDLIEINLAYGKKHIRNTAFHEALHRGFYGLPFWTNNATRKFYQWKSDKLKLPWDKQPHISSWNKDHREYINSPEEMAVQMKEFGKQLGIPAGAKYPGDALFRKMLRDYKIRKLFSNDDISWILKYLNMKNQKESGMH